MPDTPKHHDDSPELAALADGSLPADEAAALQARVDASPDLAAALARQRAAIGHVVAAQRHVVAPAGLRARVNEMRTQRGRSRRLGFAGAGIAAVAAAAAAVFFLIPSGINGETVLAEAAATHARPASEPPPQNTTDALLAYERLGVTFPAWQKSFEWATTGARSDRVRGRDVYTVTYAKDGKTVGYSVISGDRITPPDAATTRTAEGSNVRVFRRDGRTIVVFDRQGRTCVLSGVGVDEDVLVKLAAWKGKGTVAF